MTDNIHTIDLSKLVTQSDVDSISGRKYGQDFFNTEEVMAYLKNEKTIRIIINENEIKAINDSFWKGFFSEVFNEYKSKEEVQNRFEFKCIEYYKNQIEKNFEILNSIYNV